MTQINTPSQTPVTPPEPPVTDEQVAAQIQPNVSHNGSCGEPVSREWISVEDRLPEEGTHVICYAGFTPYLAYLIYGALDGRAAKTWTHEGEPEQQPTHWMPLPAEPRAAQAELDAASDAGRQKP